MDNSKRKTKRQARRQRFLLFLFMALSFGLFIKYLSGGILKDFFEKYIEDNTWYLELLKMYIVLFIFAIGYFFHIIIHEVGHLVFGLISGYEFVSFRIGSFTIIREDGRFKSKRYNIAGTGGQCLMIPPKKKDGDFPFLLYNLGGVILNTIVAVIAILIGISLKETSFLRGVLILTSGSGLFAAITNFIPIKMGSITNDGYNLRTILGDEESKDSIYLQLRVNGLLSKGIRMKDINYEMLGLEEGLDYENPLNFFRIFLNYNYHLDSLDFKGAKESLEFGEKHLHSTIKAYELELYSELLFLELLEESQNLKIEDLYDANLERYMKSSKFMMNKKRILMAYEILYRKDPIRGSKYYQELKVLAKTHPVKGEVDMELMLGEYILDRGDVK